MANIPSELRYTKDHEWIRADGDTWTVGITQFAANQLGDIVFVDVPSKGKKLDAQEPFGTIESVKSVSELFIPVSGEIVEVNEELTESPEMINTDPYSDGWIAKIKPSNKSDLDALLSAADYEKLTAEEQ